MRRSSPILAAAIGLAALASGCGTVVSTVFTEVGQAVPALPPACERSIAEFLVAIEPIVRTVDFETATEEQITSLGSAMAPAGERFDPDLCPDLDTDEARVAWLAIAEQHAPGTIGYVEYTYSSD